MGEAGRVLREGNWLFTVDCEDLFFAIHVQIV
jgi:hypothetical protein